MNSCTGKAKMKNVLLFLIAESRRQQAVQTEIRSDTIFFSASMIMLSKMRCPCYEKKKQGGSKSTKHIIVLVFLFFRMRFSAGMIMTTFENQCFKKCHKLMHLSFCFSFGRIIKIIIYVCITYIYIYCISFFNGWVLFVFLNGKMKTGRAYSLVCGILAVGNRNQTFLQFTTNHLDGERNVE